MIKIFGAAVVAALLLLPAIVLAQTGSPTAVTPDPSNESAARPPTNSGQPIEVDGFRNAKWGMTEAQVKTAIQAEFKIPAEKLKEEENPSEKTTVVSITVNDILEGAGPARISYIFGYMTKKLIQVNLVWGTPIDPQTKPELIVAAANQLRQLFLDSGYEPNTIVSNARSQDGAIVVFEGQDAEKHTTLLRLVSTPAPVNDTDKEKKSVASTALFLSYIFDGSNPDIFRLKKGQF